MRSFRFQGQIPASKSLMNRALIVQSYEPRLKLLGDSKCDDVRHLKRSLENFKKHQPLDCGEGGTTLRFLALRVSREPGRHLLKGSTRLLQRPQKEIQNILNQLGVQVRLEKKGLRIDSEGWKNPKKAVRVHAAESSQFLSALFLNAWDLDFDLQIKVQGKITSESYFEMTLKLLQEMGLEYFRRGNQFKIPAGQKVSLRKYRVEADLSSLFSVASFAAVAGAARFQEYPSQSLQPDKAFVGLFKKMGVATSQNRKNLVVRAPEHLKPLKANLQSSPDLFPVLAVLCSFSEGQSVLFGAPQLAHKESDRIAKTAELLKKAGVLCTPRSDGMLIQGRGPLRTKNSFVFDPDQDHRLAMAAALLKYFGQPIKIKNPQVVKKSFPEFWKYVGVAP